MITQPTGTKKAIAVNLDAHGHVTGRSVYVDDLPVLEGTLYAQVFYAPVAHGKIRAIDYSAAENVAGVIRIFSNADIPGTNQIGGIAPDEPLLAEGEVHFIGQPVLLIVAETMAAAHEARTLVNIDIDPLDVIVNPKEAFSKGELLHGSRCFETGDPDAAFAKAALVVEGSVEIGGQEHVYIEPQGAYAQPTENGGIRIYSSTQGPTHGQKTIARVLDLPMHKIEIDVGRIGGGFGGKEDQATMWAAFAALATYHLNKPVKIILDRKDDLQMTGKRHPYLCDYKLGLDADNRLLAYEATFFQNGGAATDLSPAVLERTLFHATGSYFIPNARLTAHCCKTNIPPNTAFRGFGGPQGMYVIESAIHHAARQLNLPAHEIQEKNLIKDGDAFPYGQVMAESEAKNCWSQAKKRFDLQRLEEERERFNATHTMHKKGLALMPVCFGISFTNTQMNQARALVHVYGDGSVGVSTGAVEMGQGVNTKMVQVAAQAFGLSLDRVKLETTNTTRVANTSPSAASATADLNGKALQNACDQIRLRLDTLAGELLNVDPLYLRYGNGKIYINGSVSKMRWEELVQAALSRRINLSAKGHYATPVIHFDKQKEKGHPFAYYAFGTAVLVCTIDCIAGTYRFDSAQIVHDCGASMNRAVDLGQIEGGIVQGIGWMTMEDLRYAEDGRLLANSLANYKVPGIYSTPKMIDTHFLNTDGHDLAILKSKAVGEPPLMYGIAAYFALDNAIRAFNPKAVIPYHAPMTPEKVLLSLYQKSSD